MCIYSNKTIEILITLHEFKAIHNLVFLELEV